MLLLFQSSWGFRQPETRPFWSSATTKWTGTGRSSGSSPSCASTSGSMRRTTWWVSTLKHLAEGTSYGENKCKCLIRSSSSTWTSHSPRRPIRMWGISASASGVTGNSSSTTPRAKCGDEKWIQHMCLLHFKIYFKSAVHENRICKGAIIIKR